jgi:PAS domain S-box-containing protein
MSQIKPVIPTYHQYLEGGGEMGELTRNFNWSDTVLGHPEQWSQSLLTTLSIMLNSRFPMFLWWGNDLIQFYNDAYRPSLGNNGKHPIALGDKGENSWQEIWPIIKPLIDQVMEGGASTWSEDQLIPIYRNGALEDVYWTFSYSRVNDETGKPGGVLVICNEVTNVVTARKDLEKTQDALQSALMAAELGTFDMDLKAGTIDWNDRCRMLFGISHSKPINYNQDFIGGLHEDDRARILKTIETAYNKAESDGVYDVEYRTVGAEDELVRWVRAKGKVYFNDKDEPLRFVGAVLDITEQKSDELRKNDFIGMVSHELKTPLTSINAYVQMMMQRTSKAGDEFVKVGLDKVNSQIKRMTTMINGFLNISRLEAGKIHLEKDDFLINDLVKAIVDETALTTSGHTINFTPCPEISIHADQNKIAAVVSNLLSNAIKYSPKGKTVEIACQQKEDLLQFSIKDQGMGIKPQDIGKLFDRFYRIETKHTQNISGFGIGLYLSAEIIHHHNGKIWVESQSGIGSTFYFTLPITS